ncbi:Rieske 2Fe-2S domain-containing protein [Leekyejoonella antrihumi]|uniref:Rieske 2Fe-2S domain-containing protein n=1 Tax=Leekyejoonella antrihumi TaxID=1660198 RepID=A0A563DWM0_9MICO|nr:Rieske 2Fe-2S domain-containing protein [Leekyejoonella antrihumi]TWP34688.1 Rieske 2Fe-2S domain-containing protein [Leekyejoonella antrihumi]
MTITTERVNSAGKNTGPLDLDELTATGLRDRWYPVLPSKLVPRGDMKKVTRLGKDWLLFRDSKGKLSVLADRCPHRNAPLSAGQHLGDRVKCQYHGVEVDDSGTVVKVPGMPGCALEGKQAALSLEVVEAAEVIFAWFPATPDSKAPEFVLPEWLGSPECSFFPNFVEWKAPWRFYLDNVLDPMHGAFLHADSHSMFQGDTTARFRIRETDRGFFFEKTDQVGKNFDWVEYVSENGLDYVNLEIPYGPEAGPGGPFGIVGIPVPISADTTAVFHWRTRKVAGWERDVWRFLYRSALEDKHWAVLEQDRNMLENFATDADQAEHLYQHDLGVARIRRMYRAAAQEQAKQIAEHG